jgi:RNase P protein component
MIKTIKLNSTIGISISEIRKVKVKRNERKRQMQEVLCFHIALDAAYEVKAKRALHL